MSHETRRPSPEFLESAVAAHVAIFLAGVSWAFGGNADWVRTPISLWGSIGILLTAAILCGRGSRAGILKGTLAWAGPVAVLVVLVLLSCLTPGFRRLVYGQETYLMPLKVPWWLPSAARPGIALRALWLFAGIYFSCLNLALAVRRRRTLRIVLALAVANALALAVFGTVQKLVGSTGIYFGSVPSPQDYFFASFVYDNHWGAFTVLMLGACVGLVLNYSRGMNGYGFFHGPALLGLAAAVQLCISIPLSGSRACTLIAGCLLAFALPKGIPAISRSLHVSGVSTAAIYSGMMLAAILAAWGAWSVAGGVIQSRALKAKDQIESAWAHRGLGARSIVYHDTWRMARARPVFGWGMGSYPAVFALYNTQVSGDRIPVVYHDAHSDWLQSVSEIGFAGTVLLGAAVAWPLARVRRMRVTPIPRFLLTACALVAAYAWVEFPFGNVAVVLAWWFCFFSSIQYMRLTALRADNP